MKNTFLKNATLGGNRWWQYLLSILAAVLAIAIANAFARQFKLPFRGLFPNTQMGETLFMFCLVLLIFGLGLVVFLMAASKLHQRPKLSFITIYESFSWKLYFQGFIFWGSFFFLSNLIYNYQKLEALAQNFDLFQFVILLLVGFIAIGIQSFFEELLFRGYFLQGLSLRIKNLVILVTINSLTFAIFHFGYGIQGFISSWSIGIAFAIIVLQQKRIEFVSGMHNAHNLLLAIVFADLNDVVNSEFSWSINWIELSVDLLTLLLFTYLVISYVSTHSNNKSFLKMNKLAKMFIVIIALFISPGQSYGQSNELSDDWIKENVQIINNDESTSPKFDFLKNELVDKRIVFLGEATHNDGATFKIRSEIIEYLIEEMDFEVVLFEAGMFDLMQANNEFRINGESDSIKKSLWWFWNTKQWQPFYALLEEQYQSGNIIQMAGFDCKFSSSYGFDDSSYSTFIENLFTDKHPEILDEDKYNDYMAIWHDIEKGYQQSGMKGNLAKIRYKMTDNEKQEFKALSQWIINQLLDIQIPTIAQMVRAIDESIIAYSDIRIVKMIFNKKSLVAINNRRDELMAENLNHLLTKVYSNKKIIVVGATYHFIRNNDLIDKKILHAIPLHESVVAGDLIYNDLEKDIFTIGFSCYEGEYGVIKDEQKASVVTEPGPNSLEYQLAQRNIDQAFISLWNTEEESFFNQGAVLRLFDHESDVFSKKWGKILDAVYFIKTMTPATR